MCVCTYYSRERKNGGGGGGEEEKEGRLRANDPQRVLDMLVVQFNGDYIL